MNWFGTQPTGKYSSINDVQKLRELCYKFENELQDATLRNQTHEQTIDELAAREEVAKVQSQTLLQELKDCQKTIEETTVELNEWKKRAFESATQKAETSEVLVVPVRKKTRKTKEPKSDTNSSTSKPSHSDTSHNPQPPRDTSHHSEDSEEIPNRRKQYHEFQEEYKDHDREHNVDGLLEEIYHLKVEVRRLMTEREKLVAEKEDIFQTFKEIDKELIATKEKCSILHKENEKLTGLHQQALTENVKLNEEKDVLLEEIAQLSQHIVEISAENFKLTQFRGETVPLPPELKLPHTEFTISWYNASYRKVPGYIYLTPHYICFTNSLAGKMISTTDSTVAIEINTISSLNKVSMGALMRHTLKRTTLEIRIVPNGVVVFSGLTKRKEMVNAIIQQATVINHPIKLLRDGNEETKPPKS